ncbi:MAG: S41 family peptidase [Crocinitomicaceae bacterium]|nr:S41 family peptidase [Crocinitomicaceae bacterium]
MKYLLSAVSIIFSLNAFGTSWMRYPSISPDGAKIVFSYQGDLFIVNAQGGNALQLTSHAAYDYMPIWSNDGSKIAFASNRHGNNDIFIIAAEGGTPTRLTYHSAGDLPCDFSNDDKTIIFKSSRLDHHKSVMYPSGVLSELYEVSVEGGREKQIMTTPVEYARYSDDGESIIYHNRKGYENEWRKHHTSSVTRDIFSYNFKTKTYTQLTTSSVEDRNAVWNGSDYYFLSEKSGSFNIWKGSSSNAYAEQITTHEKHPVRFLSIADDKTLCYGFDGDIYLVKDGESSKVNIEIKKDKAINDKTLLTVSGMRDYSVSADGKELAFIFRGEVFVTSVDYKTTKQITFTAGQERSVSFSPDGKSLVYAGERDGSWNIYEAKRKNEDEKCFFNATLIEEEALVKNQEETFQPKYSPDGKEVAFLSDRTTLKVVNRDSKKVRTVLDGKYNYSYSDGDQYFTWSPDSKWLLVQFFEFDRWSTDVGLVKATGTEKPINLTESGYSQGAPKFAMDGEMVYFTTDYWGYRSHGSWGSQRDVAAIFLTEDAYQKFKLTKEEYELWKEMESESKKEEKEDESKGKDKDKDKKDDELEVEELKIELDGLEDRMVRLTIHSSSLSDYLVTNDGSQLLYLTRFEKGFNLWSTEFREKTTKQVAKLNSWGSSLYFDKGENNVYVSIAGGVSKVDIKSGAPTPIAYSAKMELDENAERAYMFEHAWRQVREKFYVEDLHGVDWNGYKKEYARYLPFINNGWDFAEMMSELLGELNASHTGATYYSSDPNGDNTATFGCFFDPEHSKDGLKIIEIMDKSPLNSKTGKIKEGTIITHIDGEEILANENYYPMLNRKANKYVLLSFKGENGDEWDERIKLISRGEENQLCYERWVKNCEETVEKESNGELGYVHIRGMNSGSFRNLFDKALGKHNTKKALIVDTRFNGGGWLHDDLATFLSGKVYMNFEPRGQDNMGGEPIWKWQKPSCVLMSESNYSDAHLFPYTYKALGIGKLIGMPVPGTGTAVWWEFMVDGKTRFGIPQIGMRSVSEGFLVENHDLEPDIKVNNDYEQCSNGIDQQLLKGIEEMMK